MAASRSGDALQAPDAPGDDGTREEQTTYVINEDRIRLLERHSPEFRTCHIESSAPGELLSQDTFYWGTIRGVGKVYVQLVIDTFCSLAFAKCYISKMPVMACDLLYERVLPFYDALGVPVQAILTDNGREFCGKPKSHPTSCCWRWRTSSIPTPRSGARAPMASSSA
ncbi:integrase catalytic subunit [Hylemonella gracilis ATCC 19624]|uniref:Integrase catalytic subunit n=1 Tax=Hylemonella gracilis ATCC 19624 TaxID=887062 RepID=F3KXN7_9BURK|nr:integrase catalytic subunit [Hylemonella gracilis ATCC 19624]